MSRSARTQTASSIHGDGNTTGGAHSADALGATGLIDRDHPAIRQAAMALTRDATTDQERALALFRFVSTQIKFGFCRGFWNNRASDVLQSRRGYCNTKSTLFIALLRAVNVPARQVFVDIDAQVLSGILAPGTAYVDHSYVEVFLEGSWRPTDAYIVDPPLFRAAQLRLQKSGQSLGFAAHAAGSTSWNGIDPSFSQLPLPHQGTVSTQHHGIYADVADFYRQVPAAWNRLNPFLRGMFGLVAAGANRQAERLRLEREATTLS